MPEQALGGVPLEVVAAITAVITVMLSRPPDEWAIRSITPLCAGAESDGWAMAGRFEQHLSRSFFGNSRR